jgi:uncharacterized protein YjbJ (UPF0337 family)
MTNDRIAGLGHQVKGAAKAEFGKLIGDEKMKVDGAAEQEAGRAQGAAARSDEPILGMDQDRIAGIGHQMAGAMKEGFGKLIGNPTMAASGVAERAAGKLQNAAGSLRDEQREAARPPENE